MEDHAEKINPRHSTQVDASVKTRHSTTAMQFGTAQEGSQAAKQSIFEDPDDAAKIYKTKLQTDQEKRYGELSKYQLNYQSSSSLLRQEREHQDAYFVHEGGPKTRETTMRIPASKTFAAAGKDKADLEAAMAESRSSEIRVGSKPDDRLDFDKSEEGDATGGAKEE